MTELASEHPIRRRRYFSLWYELLRLSWRRAPLLTSLQFVIPSLMVASVVGNALALRGAVDATMRGEVWPAVACAAGAGLAGTLLMVLGALDSNGAGILIGKVAVLDVNPGIYNDIATLEGLEHLERTDYLDRLTVVRNSAWEIVLSLWQATGVLFILIELVVTLFLLGTINPWLLLLLLCAALPLWFDQKGSNAIIRAETDVAEAFRLQRRLFDLGTDGAAGKEIRVAGAGSDLARRQAAAWEAAMAGRYRARLVAAAWKLGGWTVFTLGFGGGLALIVVQVLRGHSSAGDLVLAITVASSLRQSVFNGVNFTANVARAGRLIEPYLWMRDYTASARSDAAGTEPSPEVLREGITFENVTYQYPGSRRPALDDVSVHLPAGSVVALVGEYGSGKTTLVKLFCKFYKPSSGRVLVDGVDLATLDTEGWRARSSAAFQDFGRFRTTFGQSVGLGDLPHARDAGKVGRAVAAADAEKLVGALPDGLETELSRDFGGVDLSEGQWQKVALARASMRPGPLLLMLDEPTASLDAPSEQQIFERYIARAREVAERTGAITLIVTHRFSTATGADLILTLDKGRLIEAGTHDELVGMEGGRYADLYGIQADAYSA
ncbi:ABC transporter ATP-binding protein [Streptomyces sp. NBC_00059]|uniref:ATP-binding cassette domain-containing protein n=1 Tax=Streptomyces sp. NBC_00059 TaxID=2975635 RepID=UPI0022589E3B|nr:ABC transporter ATP-binding protein [Streptomyces sp. NBC_00059]MCX5417308.1 ABC transporter ATP-binding protein/permease [Streptomyces sp. NBC_00059]